MSLTLKCKDIGIRKSDFDTTTNVVSDTYMIIHKDFKLYNTQDSTVGLK